MRNPATFLASLTIGGALLIGGCSVGTGTSAGADGTTTALSASSTRPTPFP